jgi:hypothetical protein
MEDLYAYTMCKHTLTYPVVSTCGPIWSFRALCEVRTTAYGEGALFARLPMIVIPNSVNSVHLVSIGCLGTEQES